MTLCNIVCQFATMQPSLPVSNYICQYLTMYVIMQLCLHYAHMSVTIEFCMALTMSITMQLLFLIYNYVC